MSPSPVLALSIDEQTHLRLLEEQYAQEFFALTERNRTYLQEWMPWAAGEGSLEETKAYMKQSLLQFANREAMRTGIWYQDRLVGVISFEQIDWTNLCVEIGYWIDAAMQGKGLVTTVCRALVSYAFEQYQLNKVEIHCAAENRRSRAIPERLGFAQEGILRQAERFADWYNDLVVYGMLASEWRE
jgi:ribosomal-protein-serine acetyltransferase